MKIKHSAFLLFTFLFISAFSYAQEGRYIEITVSDTIVEKPVSYVYKVTAGDQPIEFMGMTIPTSENNNEGEAKVPLETITKFLDKEKFSYTVSPVNNYTVIASADKPEAKPEILVTLGSEAELKRLAEALQKQGGLSGQIKETIYESAGAQIDSVYSHLYSKAVKQATIIANISGNHLGALISVSDVADEKTNMMDMYKQIMKIMPKGMFGEPETGNKNIEVKMIYKFELK